MTAIYLDHNATTPVDPVVLEAMLPYLQGEYGNASSSYPLGRRAKEAIEGARREVAALIGARPEEIVFTGCATESTNIAVRGALAVRTDGRRKIVTSTIEHPATDACCLELERSGYSVDRVACERDGHLDPDRVASAVDGGTALVTLIHAQNEIGTIQPLRAVAEAAWRYGALLHADAAQSLGKIPVSVDALGVDLMTIAGHKLYAPKGVGALYIRRGTALAPVLCGAGQERGLRPGTENVAFIVALGAACRLAARRLREDADRVAALTRELHARLSAAIPGLVLVGAKAERLPNTLNLLFPHVSGRRLLEDCPEIMASTGSACHAGSEEPSAILASLGLPREAALGAVRLSLGYGTTAAEIETAAVHLAGAWSRLAARARAA